MLTEPKDTGGASADWFSGAVGSSITYTGLIMLLTADEATAERY